MTRIQVSTADHPDEERILAAAPGLGVTGLRGCRRWTVYHLDGCLSPDDIERLCREVLVDPVTDTAVVGPPPDAPQVVEVAPIAGVTDPEARELERVAATLGLGPLRAATARRYELHGDLDDADIDLLVRRLLANPTIEHSSRGALAPAFSPRAAASLVVEPVRMAGLDDRALADLSQRRLLSLDSTEMRAIQAHFASTGRDPTVADRLGSLVRAVQGCVEGARRYRAPFVSGKDSLYNEFEGNAVVGTLLISAVGVVRNLHRATTSALTEPGHDLWLVGEGSHCLGGSLAAEMLDIGDTRVPAPVSDPLDRYRAVHRLIADGRVTAAHDVSDGGVAVALTEMAIGGGLGLQATIPWDTGGTAGERAEEADDSGEVTKVAGGPVAALFNEAPGQLVLESPAAERASVAATLGRFGQRIGTVTGTGSIEIRVDSAGGWTVTVEAARRAFGCGSQGP